MFLIISWMLFESRDALKKVKFSLRNNFNSNCEFVAEVKSGYYRKWHHIFSMVFKAKIAGSPAQSTAPLISVIRSPQGILSGSAVEPRLHLDSELVSNLYQSFYSSKNHNEITSSDAVHLRFNNWIEIEIEIQPRFKLYFHFCTNHSDCTIFF